MRIVCAGAGIDHITFFDIEWLNEVIRILSGVGSTALAFILFPGLISAVIGMFMDEVAPALRERYGAAS